MWSDGVWGMMGGWGSPLQMIVPLLFWVLAIALIAFLVRLGWTAGERSNTSGRPSARDLLDERYARGEIEREEYLRRKTDIAS